MALEQVLLPMVGKILKVNINVGDSVNEDDTIMTFESMKLEMPLMANIKGVVKEIKVQAGQTVEADQVVAVIEY